MRMVELSIDGDDRWTIPDDRQLALRGRLDTGWSSYKGYSRKGEVLTEEEFLILSDVMSRRDAKQKQEELRIGTLVKKLENMRTNVLGDGIQTCLICGTKAGLLKDSLNYCLHCGHLVCQKCGVDSKITTETSKKLFYCVICNEERQLWKSSGAWFYNSIPKYVISDVGSELNSNMRVLGRNNSFNTPRPVWIENRSMSHESDATDDDLETTSFNAFEISDERSQSWHGQIEVNSPQLKFSNVKRSCSDLPNIAPKSPTLSYSSNQVDGVFSDRMQTNGLTSRGHLNNNSNSDLAYERQRSYGSTLSLEMKPDKKNLLGIKRLVRNQSRDSDLDKVSKGSKQNDFGSSDNMSNCSEQDIDSLFKEEAQNQAVKEKKEYYGKIGMIEFTLKYDASTEELHVIIQNCKGLCGDVEKGKLPFPYVKTYLLPEANKATKKRTSTLKKTADPVFNETLVYHGISETDIRSKGLKLSVMDEKSRHSTVIGETSIPLKNLSMQPVQQFRRILDVRNNSNPLYLESHISSNNPGRIELALHYLSKQEKLVVGIIRCAGLKAHDSNGYSDPFVKCYLLPDPQKHTKQKTAIKKKTLNPEFNEEFTYKIAHHELAKRTLHITVWDHDVGRTNDFIGGITLGIQSTPEALKHWFETLKTADKKVIKWHTLSEDCPAID
ncbi:synaptotagmin-like protein 4 isoform X2 [Hydra vulgaris]|uniref:Double C2-like domain-containing protein beta n=1 Tax=Hydra vulgaris TaxID=6087 RepID=T2MCX6_HYDVU|nr:synaptotagmin-like protein 4 [Hydra vulgaris]